jgi:hypothetical protein
MSLSPHLHLGAEVLSHQAKNGVEPIAKPAPRVKKPLGLHRRAELARTELARTPGPSKRTPLGRATIEQKARCADQVCIVCGGFFDECHPAHVVPRGHPKMTGVAADDTRAVVPLCARDHDLFDEGKLDLLPHLEPAWRDSQEWAAGAVGLATAMRSITGGSA